MTHFWLTSLTLVALGQHLCSACGRRQGAFTVAELLAWAPGLGQARTAHRACNMLAHAGLLKPAPPSAGTIAANRVPTRPAAWCLTAPGVEAARAAHHEAAARKRAQALLAANHARRYSDTVAMRLWTLLRARRALTSLEAVELLGDAGAPSTLALRKQVTMLLAAWHTLMPDTVQVAARRVGRCHRYVLVGDVGRRPPEALRNADNRARALKAAKGAA